MLSDVYSKDNSPKNENKSEFCGTQKMFFISYSENWGPMLVWSLLTFIVWRKMDKEYYFVFYTQRKEEGCMGMDQYEGE